MREYMTRLFLLVLCAVMVTACAAAPYKTSMQLNPEPGKATLGPQELDQAFEAAVATGLDLGYKVVSSSREQRVVTLNRFRMADMVSETLNVDIENKGATADVTIVYESPKPLAEATVKEFTDRFHAKLSAGQPAKPLTPVAGSAPPGAVRTEPVPTTAGDKPAETNLILLKNSNIRTEPNTKSKIIATLRKGEKVVKIDESGKWFNVRLPTGETGWVLKTLVKEAD